MNKEFDYDIVKNPEIFQVNRLPVYADNVIFASEEERSSMTTSYRFSLNGIWKFSYASNYSFADKNFHKEDYDCNNWDDIYVPAHIQMEGYDKPHYTNTTYPWDGHEWTEPGQIPEEFNPVASYVNYFEVPENFEGKKICISFQGVESGFALWLNGHFIGYAEDTFDSSDFELTPYIKSGVNKLAVRVFKWTASSWCEDQDFFRFSGIYRDVFLYCIPDVHVLDVKVKTTLDDDFANGEVVVELKTLGSGRIQGKLYDSAVGVVHATTWDLSERAVVGTAVEDIAENKCVLKYELKDVNLWSAEKPNLYVAVIEVMNESGEVVEVFSVNVGMRRFEMVDGIMCLNGKRIVFKGVNRHEFSSAVGRVPVYADLVKDIVNMKRSNINGIRTCHYPDCTKIYTDGKYMPGIYDLCDVYGLYMIAENNMETHGSWEAYCKKVVDLSYVVPKDNIKWEAMLLDRVNSCYQTNKNHPAVLIWSCGNESYGGSIIAKMADKFRELDDSRLVHYEGVFNDRSNPETSDMESQMYPSVASIEKFLEENKDNPFICCEYTHAMGNSCGGMHLYTDLTDRQPRYQGGFIWDYIDQSIYKKDRYGNEFLAYGGDFDDRPSDYEFSGNGIAYGGNRDISPKMQDVKYNYRNISVSFSDETFTVTNKNLFVNTNEYSAFLVLYADGEEVRRQKLSVDVEPLCDKEFMIPEAVLGMMASDAKKEYSIIVSFVLKEDTIWGCAGHEVAFGQKIYKKTAEKYTCGGRPEIIRGNNNIGIKGKNFSMIFSKGTIGIVSYVYAGREMINYIPRPNFWRAPTNNDEGYMMQAKYAQWKIASLYVSTKENARFEDATPTIQQTDNSIIVSYKYKLPTKPAAQVDVCYEVFNDGTVGVDMSYDPVKELGDMPEFGMIFKLSADYDRLKWYGLGPEETYVDRMMGAKLGIYENKVADNMAEYLMPQECGNKCGVRYALVTDKKGRGMKFMGDELSFSALPYTPHEIENASHAYELPPVHSTVVRVAKQQMGIAGDDSWGARVHPEYLIDVNDKIRFNFYFRGI